LRIDKQVNTDFQFHEFISLATILDNPNIRQSFYWDDWGSTTSDQQLFLKLQKGVSPAFVEAGLNKILFKYQGEDEKKNNFTWKYRLQPLSDIHFNTHYGILLGNVVPRSTSYGLLIVAGILLLLACINFINLTTAQASRRAREIGIRKTLGSSQKQLVIQFLSETLLITILATLLSLLMTPLLLKIFSDYIPDGLQFSFDGLLHQVDLLLFVVILVLGVSGVAGFYPALVLSSWRPVQVLKNQVKHETGKSRRVWVRQVLTVSQFVIAQTFIIGTFFVTKQIRFLLDKDLGFRKEAVLSFRTPDSDTSWSRRLVLLHQLQSMPGISMSSIASDVPSSGGTWSTSMTYKDGNREVQTAVELKFGDSNYLRLFDIPLLAGRKILASDTVKEVLVNENYMKVLGFQHPEDVLGKTLSWNDKQTPIVGVLKDFHTHPLSQGIKPLSFSFGTSESKRLIVTLPPGKESHAEWKSTISNIEKAYKAIYPDEDFNYGFLDNDIAGFYQTEQKLSGLLRWASGLAIFISCLGLLGLVIFTTNLRTKEIGVRKVLGASVSNIVVALSKDFLKLVCLAFVIATPVGWWFVHQWFGQFAFRTSVSWWVFVISGVAMLLIAFITLSLQTVRAANMNPVRSLRTE
jgi:putative ABC transport system permease protein